MVGPANCALIRQRTREDEAWKRDGWSRACQEAFAGDPIVKPYLQPLVVEPTLSMSAAPKGRKWLDESAWACAEREEPAACTVVAKAYAWGCRVEPNGSYARELFRWSCAAGALDACYAFDRFSDEASDSAFFNAQIQRLLAERCERADAKSCRDLAQLTWNGYRGTPRSEQRTLDLLKAPCAMQDAEACRELAFFYSLATLSEGRREAQAIHESWCKPEHLELRWPCDEVVKQALQHEAAGQHAAAARSFAIACAAGVQRACRTSNADAGSKD